MALQLRRGLSTNRTSITPATGELIYTTDTKLVYVGDGTTAGGNVISGGGGGITDIVNDTTPQLGGALDVNGYKIVSAGNANIEIDPAGTGDIILHGNLTINEAGNITKTGQLNISPTTLTSFGNNSTLVDGNVYITRNSYTTAANTGFTFAQHHNTADAMNFTFYRTRGTGAAPTAIVNGDDIVDLAFAAYDGSTDLAAGNITCQADGVVSTGKIPGRFRFALHDGITTGSGGLRAVAELSAAGIWKVNSIAPFSGTTLSLTAGNLVLNAQADLRFADADSSNYVAFQAPSTVASNVTWTLPATDGTIGQALTTNGTGTLAWATISGGGGATVSVTATSVLYSSSGTSIDGSSNFTTDGNGAVTAVALRAKTFTQLDSSGTGVGTTTHTAGVTLNDTGINTLRFRSASFDVHSNDVIIGDDNAFDGRVTIQSGGAATKTLSLKSYNSSATSGTLSLFKSRGTKASPTAVSINDEIYNVAFEGWSGTSTLLGARISAEISATPSSTVMPSDLVFETTDTGGVTNVVGRFTNAGIFKPQEIELQTPRITTASTVLAIRTTLAGNPVINVRCTNNGNVEVSQVLVASTTISPMVTNADLTLTGNGTGKVAVTGNMAATGTVTASSFTSTAVGTPTMTSATDIRLAAAGVVHVTQTPFRLASFDTAGILTLTPVNGDMIYNSSTSKIQAYAGGAWVDLH